MIIQTEKLLLMIPGTPASTKRKAENKSLSTPGQWFKSSIAVKNQKYMRRKQSQKIPVLITFNNVDSVTLGA